MNKINKSIELFKEAKLHMPGGVNSPVRAFKNIDGNPIFFKKAKGPYIFDVKPYLLQQQLSQLHFHANLPIIGQTTLHVCSVL